MYNYLAGMTGTGSIEERTVIEPWDAVFRSLAAEPRRQSIVSLRDTPPDRTLSLPEAANPPSLF